MCVLPNFVTSSFFLKSRTKRTAALSLSGDTREAPFEKGPVSGMGAPPREKRAAPPRKKASLAPPRENWQNLRGGAGQSLFESLEN